MDINCKREKDLKEGSKVFSMIIPIIEIAELSNEAKHVLFCNLLTYFINTEKIDSIFDKLKDGVKMCIQEKSEK
jgi:hypothetical protein